MAKDNFFVRLWEKIKFERKMRMIDEEWYMLGGSCFGMYPPSFYYRHTPEEQKQIRERDLAEIRRIIDSMGESEKNSE